uniref:Uncharacterized protein n=1 Tax=Rhizophora mucronata TaxID=61149 RepID=A0A2P2N6T6_RHIMU
MRIVKRPQKSQVQSHESRSFSSNHNKRVKENERR